MCDISSKNTKHKKCENVKKNTYLALSREMATNSHAEAMEGECNHGAVSKHPTFPNGQCLSYMIRTMLWNGIKIDATTSVIASPITNFVPGWSGT